MTEIKNRYDFVLLFDVQDGNPNGDPDAGNLPRIDQETGHGLVTDVCLKRKIRNYVQTTRHDKPPFEIYVKEKAVLNLQNRRAYEYLKIDLSTDDAKKKAKRNIDQARAWMCTNFYDVRTFGAVMSTGEKDGKEGKEKDPGCGQVRGPVQLTFARSLTPVVTLEHCITRMAVTTVRESEDQGGDNRTMGRKFTIPYGLYRSFGFLSPSLARQTGFSEEDLSLLWEALVNMFEHDRSASRGMMQTRGLYVFKHETELGCAPAHKLFDLITVSKKLPEIAARSFDDYLVQVTEENLPKGVELIQMHKLAVPATA